MKKKSLRILLPVFLMTLCILNTKTPAFSSADRNNAVAQIMPCSDIDDYSDNKDN